MMHLPTRTPLDKPRHERSCSADVLRTETGLHLALTLEVGASNDSDIRPYNVLDKPASCLLKPA